MHTVPTDSAVGVDQLAELLRTETHAFPPADAVRRAARRLHDGWLDDLAGPATRRGGDLALDISHPRFSGHAALSVTPGGLVLHARKLPPGREPWEVVLDTGDGWQHALPLADRLASDEDLSCVHGPIVPKAPAESSRWWDARSRSRMVRALASVDWTPLFFMKDTRPAMVTLTYPGDWLTVAPDAPAAKAHLAKLHKRIDRLYDKLGLPPIPGVWKLEFQSRGAPHFHAYLPVLVDKIGCTCTAAACTRVHLTGRYKRWNGARLRDWLSFQWADIVDHPDPDEKARHLAAGTGIDFAEGARCSDPKRLAVYFTRHNAKGGKGKAHQHRVPPEWADAGRWWGTWRVERLAVEVPITNRELVETKRLLRRWLRSKRVPGVPTPGDPWPTEPRTVPREVRRVDSKTGVIGTRWTTRRYALRSLSMGQGGFIISNDGPALAGMVGRYLDHLRA